MVFMGLGELPKEYNRKVHGPYGKKDAPLAEVKVGELPKWLARRNYSPTAMGRCFSRGYWRWSHKFMQPRNAGMAPYIQV